MISFVIPAHNEAELLGRTLAALIASAQTVGEPWEAVVVNDASTDRTAEIGLAHSALGLLRVGIRLALGRRSALDYWYGQRPGAGSQTPNRVLAPPG